ncbi:Calx-beta domain-containing protein [Limnospira fusiformis]|uniref:Calx-beta domain-containing protein n=1 Tax=Limnospira fusiformis TaxID=54297 RepID=UPI002AA0EF9A|nr:Calx-beta domain-containing protein [Limnospira fusiformis LS22]
MENTREILSAIMPEPSDYPNPLPPVGFSGDGSVNPLTAAAQIEAALTQVNQQLTEFVASANFQGDLQTAFGASTDVELGATIIEALTQGETPEMMVLSARAMNGADGAFDSLTGTVYLSDAIIHSEKLVDVITEEFGHYIDSQLNEIDSPGDEGELFMRLVNGEALTEADITGLRSQNDWGFIWVEGEPVAAQMSAPPEFAWTRLLGTWSWDEARALTTGSDGSIYVAGWTWGDLDGETNSSNNDAFITKYQPDGTKDWTRLLGTSGRDEAHALTTGSDGSIYVAGFTGGNLDGQRNSGGWEDAFITKYQPDGSKDWTRLLGTRGGDRANALTTGSDGSIYVAGRTYGNLDGQTNSGQNDAFITKYQPDGTKNWTRLLGTSSWDEANALTTGRDGSIYVAGRTEGNLDGQTNSGWVDAFITKYQPDGTKDWTRLLGTRAWDGANALTTGSDGSIYVAGKTWGNLDGQRNSGGGDAFITKYQPDGTKAWTRLLGTSQDYYLPNDNALTTGSDGSIYVAGYTDGDLDGQTHSGRGSDAFISRFQPDGSKDWTRLLGTRGWDKAHALTTGSDGSIYVAGGTTGNLGGQRNSGRGDGFISKLIIADEEDEDLPQISIRDTQVKEGDSGRTNARFVVTLDNPSPERVTVNYATADGTATAGEDYERTTGRLIFRPGQTRQVITVPVFGDTEVEPDETFMVNLRRPQNAQLARAQAIGTIINDDDDDLPQITIADTEIIEGDSGRTNARFLVRLDNPSSQRVVVNYATADGTATAGEDYERTTGRLIFRPGQTRQVITVPVFGDTEVEPDETFMVNLRRPQNAQLARAQAIGTIINDDDDDLPQITIADTEIIEGDSGQTNARFVVTLDNPSSQRVTVNYATADGTATVRDRDYERTTGRLIFRPGQTRQVITVPVFGDTEVEPDETFMVNLRRPQNAQLARAQAIGTIINDDYYWRPRWWTNQ